MAGNEVHQAKIQRLDAGQGSNLPNFTQRAVGFDQYVHRNLALDIQSALDVAQGLDLNLYISGAARFG